VQQAEFKLRVGLNALFWQQESTGSGQYLRHLWQSLDRSGSNEYHLLRYQLMPSRPFSEDVSLPDEVRYPTSLNALGVGEKGLKVWWEQFGIPQMVRQAAQQGQPYDVIHYPYFAAPLQRLPRSTGLIVTIHDLIPLALPEYAPSLALKLYFRLVRTAARRADLIMADSEYSKQDILRFLKVPARKVQVVYLGVDERYQPGPVSALERRALLQRYGLAGDERLIFYLGGFDRRKNLITLLEAFGEALPRLKEREQADGGGKWVLALAGKPHTNNPLMYPDLSEPIGRIFGPDEAAVRVRFLGRVTEEDKPLLYRAADLFAFPSLYEGFGLDPLEALASGTPVLCSDATCLPEVVGQAGRLLSPTSVAAWREALVELVSRPAERAKLAAAGPEQAAKFSWQKTAERTLQLYNVVECVRTRGVARG